VYKVILLLYDDLRYLIIQTKENIMLISKEVSKVLNDLFMTYKITSSKIDRHFDDNCAFKAKSITTLFSQFNDVASQLNFDFGMNISLYLNNDTNAPY